MAQQKAVVQTLDQQRAQFAWQAAQRAKVELGDKFGDFRNLAKGAPALIMGNGLMAALAFYQSRGEVKSREATLLVNTMLGWLGARGVASGFPAAMAHLQSTNSRQYMQLTEEALAMLRWLRQFSDALRKVD